MDVVTVSYSDERLPRRLYEDTDYSAPVELRRCGDILYVHWAVTLFHTEHWLLAFDLPNRREVWRRRVEASDLEHTMTPLSAVPGEPGCPTGACSRRAAALVLVSRAASVVASTTGQRGARLMPQSLGRRA